MTTARDIMHPGATCIGEDQTLSDAARMMRNQGVGALPICGADDRLKGVITDRDIVVGCIALGKDPARVGARDFAGHVHCVRAGDSLDEVLRKMASYKIRRLPVIEDERLVGMISEHDLAVAHAGSGALSDGELAGFMDRVYATG